MSLGIHFPILLCQTNQQHLVWWTVSGHCRNSSPVCIKHQEKCECMHRWTQWTFSTFNISLWFVFWFQCNLFLWQIEHMSGMGGVTFQEPCICFANNDDIRYRNVLLCILYVRRHYIETVWLFDQCSCKPGTLHNWERSADGWPSDPTLKRGSERVSDYKCMWLPPYLFNVLRYFDSIRKSLKKFSLIFFFPQQKIIESSWNLVYKYL
jgi:hypothetical protein